MTSLRLIVLGGLTALAVPLSSPAQQKATYPDSEAGQHAGEEATVTGKVAAVTKAKDTTFVNFGDRFPRQTFTGVVFSRDAEKVGDLKQFEGKEVALTGRIELSRDQKPQIIISKPEQIRLAGEAAPAAPAPKTSAPPPAKEMPAPPPSPASPPPAPSPLAAVVPPGKPAPAPAPKIALAANWNSPAQGGEMTRKDLATLFAGRGIADASADSVIMVYPGIPFLAPLAAAKKQLNLEGASASKTRVTCPGMPVGSFSAYTFSGVFAGGFSRLCLVTDNADQVVSVLLVDENSRQRATGLSDSAGYHTYNFINLRVKGTNDLVIKHEIAADSPPGVVLVESLLVDPHDSESSSKSSSSRSSSSKSSSSSRTPRSGKVLERSNWYVPVPVVSLILRCASGR